VAVTASILLAFALSGLYAYLVAKYTRSVNGNIPRIAAFWDGCVECVGLLRVLVIIDAPLTILPAIIGSVLGTWLSVASKNIDTTP
jgi:hypothetical protein